MSRPGIRRGKKPVVVVGNRMRARTRAERELQDFLSGLGHEVGAQLHDRSLYQEVARRGLGVFDLSPAKRAMVVQDWLPLVSLIERQA